MRASKLFREINEILRQNDAVDCDVGFDRINDMDYITIIVNDEYQRYTLDWERVI